MRDLTTERSVRIEAPIDDVWSAITDPPAIKRWFLGVDTETNWEVGGSVVHRGTYDGKPYEDRGEIIRFEPPRLLVHTHWSDASGLPDEPGNHQEVTWSLAEHDGATDLSVGERNLPSEEAKATSEQAWAMALGNLKDLLEDGRIAAPDPDGGTGSATD
jgi:uncharacterized protein YndB with AHSA1/START domain